MKKKKNDFSHNLLRFNNYLTPKKLQETVLFHYQFVRVVLVLIIKYISIKQIRHL